MKLTVASDIHAGSNICEEEAAFELVKQADGDKFVLLGDILNGLERKMSPFMRAFLYALRCKAQAIETIWIAGNHDEEFGPLARSMGIKWYPKYYQFQDCIFTHGHLYDPFMSFWRKTKYLLELPFEILERMNFKRTARTLKRFSKYVGDSDKHVMEHVVQQASLFRRAFAGHTHRQLQQLCSGVQYFNAGCYTDGPDRAGYYTVTETSTVWRKL